MNGTTPWMYTRTYTDINRGCSSPGHAHAYFSHNSEPKQYQAATGTCVHTRAYRGFEQDVALTPPRVSAIERDRPRLPPLLPRSLAPPIPRSLAPSLPPSLAPSLPFERTVGFIALSPFFQLAGHTCADRCAERGVGEWG
eukprot:GHVU01227304.1.p1 GENE.GHVU01227304.1~~GHVU01227304.1.p1  ORF type:complete len:140 (-),score=5.18 GHVU01227304.1:450-869(-)